MPLGHALSLVMEAHRKDGRVDGKTKKQAEVATKANPDLRDKLPLILSFVDAMNTGKAQDTEEGWTGHVEERMVEEMNRMCQEHSQDGQL